MRAVQICVFTALALVPRKVLIFRFCLMALAEQIAGLTKDGEMIEVIEEDSVEFEMTAEDAVDTLHSLISQTRTLLGVPDRYPE